MSVLLPAAEANVRAHAPGIQRARVCSGQGSLQLLQPSPWQPKAACFIASEQAGGREGMHYTDCSLQLLDLARSGDI